VKCVKKNVECHPYVGSLEIVKNLSVSSNSSSVTKHKCYLCWNICPINSPPPTPGCRNTVVSADILGLCWLFFYRISRKFVKAYSESSWLGSSNHSSRKILQDYSSSFKNANLLNLCILTQKETDLSYFLPVHMRFFQMHDFFLVLRIWIAVH
jgi:hypothetical protein